jgi:hypothetical protein
MFRVGLQSIAQTVLVGSVPSRPQAAKEFLPNFKDYFQVISCIVLKFISNPKIEHTVYVSYSTLSDGSLALAATAVLWLPLHAAMHRNGHLGHLQERHHHQRGAPGRAVQPRGRQQQAFAAAQRPPGPRQRRRQLGAPTEGGGRRSITSAAPCILARWWRSIGEGSERWSVLDDVGAGVGCGRGAWAWRSRKTFSTRFPGRSPPDGTLRMDGRSILDADASHQPCLRRVATVALARRRVKDATRRPPAAPAAGASDAVKRGFRAYVANKARGDSRGADDCAGDGDVIGSEAAEWHSAMLDSSARVYAVYRLAAAWAPSCGWAGVVPGLGVQKALQAEQGRDRGLNGPPSAELGVRVTVVRVTRRPSHSRPSQTSPSQAPHESGVTRVRGRRSHTSQAASEPHESGGVGVTVVRVTRVRRLPSHAAS